MWSTLAHNMLGNCLSILKGDLIYWNKLRDWNKILIMKWYPKWAHTHTFLFYERKNTNFSRKEIRFDLEAINFKLESNEILISLKWKYNFTLWRINAILFYETNPMLWNITRLSTMCCWLCLVESIMSIVTH